MNEICSIENMSFQFFSLETVKRLTIKIIFSSIHLVDVHRDMPVSRYLAFSWIKHVSCTLLKFTVICGAQILQTSLPVYKQQLWSITALFTYLRHCWFSSAQVQWKVTKCSWSVHTFHALLCWGACLYWLFLNDASLSVWIKRNKNDYIRFLTR